MYVPLRPPYLEEKNILIQQQSIDEDRNPVPG